MYRLLVPLALLVVALPASSQDKKQSYSTEYYPLKVGYKWIYQGVDPKEKITIAVDHAEPIKRRVSLPNGSERTDVLESYVLRLTSGDKSQLEQMVVTEDGVYRYAAAGKEISPPIRLLKLPVVEGEKWSVNSTSENVPLKGDFVVNQEAVDLPGRKGMKAWRVKSVDFMVGEGATAQRIETNYWFVSGVGVVKQHVKDRKTDLTITLEEFKAGSDPTPPASTTLPTLPKLPPPMP